MAAGIEIRKGPRGTKYRARVWSPRDGRHIDKTFDSLAEAKSWRVDALKALQDGVLRPSSKLAVRDAAAAWLEDAKAGRVRNRSGKRFKPSTLRGYERVLKLRVLPAIGTMQLSGVRRRDIQDLVDRLLAEGDTASTVRNALDPLRSLFRWAVRREEIGLNPTRDIDVPSDEGAGRRRAATPEEVPALLEALPEDDRALWSTALYTGLRRGELRELRWSDIDLDEGVICVQRGLDDNGEIIGTKTEAGAREVPILSEVRRELVAHKLRTGRSGDDLVFGRTARTPFVPSTIGRRAKEAWQAAGLTPITLHECRHTAASELRAAGVDFKMIQTIIGRSTATRTSAASTCAKRPRRGTRT